MASLEIALPKAEDLEALFTSLIAQDEHVEKDEVTVEYIRKRREKSFYPTTRYQTESTYGGNINVGLVSLTRKGSVELEILVDEIMARI